jgi:transposase
MDAACDKPTWSESSIEQRQEIIRLHQSGLTYAAIAEQVGCSLWTVGRWVRAWQRAGEAGLAYKSRRPTSRHPQTTAGTIQDRIRTIRHTHPGWGARLIRHQLLLDGVSDIPSEVTIQAWLRRQGFPLVRPATAKPTGWREQRPVPLGPIWQVDFKQKGGPPI